MPGIPRKKFLVFYDYKKRESFVAVQRNTGLIHTVMPRSFKTFPWITNDIYEKAKRVYERSVKMEEKERARAAIEAEKKASELRRQKAHVADFSSATVAHVFLVNINLMNEEGCRRTKKLLSIPSHHYEHSIPNLLSDKALPEKLQMAFDNLKVPSKWSVSGLTIRSHKDLVYLPLQ